MSARGRGGMAPAGARAVALVVALAIAAATGAIARAQDFATPVDAISPALASPCGMIEHGFAAVRTAPAIELATIRWFGLPELTTRAAAAAAGWRALRAAAGVSQTGDPEVGWTGLGAALGVADSSGGAAVRAVARRDRTSRFGFDARGAAVGLEVGGGAWVAVAPGVALWASAPQMWTRGEAPPAARALGFGGAARIGALTLWLARESVAGPPRGRAEHAAGLGASAGPLAIALSARDQPLRGGVTLAARAPHCAIAAGVESHPVLGETVKLAITAGGGR
ncbi:MAG: hypothetical protein HY076_04060 [Candidatus Eisenbacteria bacterium]|uniref:Uncharacterized protein n=1 Tax=Eiseniibacteriota bacterium TaxID=2212470 RepID=A0A9D6L430_UNCEI|nr:hypothetical protein [Candidatus Eisenbacteria bacterium]